MKINSIKESNRKDNFYQLKQSLLKGSGGVANIWKEHL